MQHRRCTWMVLPTLYNGPHVPPSKLSLLMGDRDHYLIQRSLGPRESTSQMAPRSLQPFLQGHDCDRQTDRQTDRPRNSISNNRPHLRSTVMRPKNCIVISKVVFGTSGENRKNGTASMNGAMPLPPGVWW